MFTIHTTSFHYPANFSGSVCLVFAFWLFTKRTTERANRKENRRERKKIAAVFVFYFNICNTNPLTQLIRCIELHFAIRYCYYYLKWWLRWTFLTRNDGVAFLNLYSAGSLHLFSTPYGLERHTWKNHLASLTVAHSSTWNRSVFEWRLKAPQYT